MDLKSPVKKGYKMPPYRAPLPILSETSSGLVAEDYDWPVFNGYYNGTSVIVDDAHAISVLTTKGSFGKGSLSKGCINLRKRKIPYNVVYESQWKRRKKWIECLSSMLKNKSVSPETTGQQSTGDSTAVLEDNVEKNEASSLEKSNCEKDIENTFLPIDNIKKDTIVISDPETSDVELIKDEVACDKQTNVIDISDVSSIKNVDISEESSLIHITDSSSNETVTRRKDSENLINKSRRCTVSKEKGTLNNNEVLVISDIETDLEQYFMNLNPHIEEENIKTALEVLYLSLEEAFFLCYACNCLQIVDLSTNILRIKDIWVLFQKSQPDFVEKYVAYHYFRAKGWVVKSGTKFGGDFLLYKKGPLYFHASYVVIVEVTKKEKNVKKHISWQKIFGMNRMAESATKEILICHVIWPDVENNLLENPSILKEFRVDETLLRRWQATQEKTA